jgi:hypothetical protein
MSNPALYIDDENYPPLDPLEGCNFTCGLRVKPCTNPKYESHETKCDVCGHFEDCHVLVRFEV